MRPEIQHKWNISPRQAIAIQKDLASRVSRKNVLSRRDIRHIAGLDVAYTKKTNRCYAAVVVFDFIKREPVVSETAILPAPFPYIPGLLSFREIPPLVRVLDRVRVPIDLMVCDGQGIAHPRGIGLASHLGVIYDCPAIGCAKSLLFGIPEGELSEKAGSWIPIRHPKTGVIIASLVRTRDCCRPVIVSSGHKVSLPFERRLILDFCGGYRIPEITRQPHLLSNEIYRADTC